MSKTIPCEAVDSGLLPLASKIYSKSDNSGPGAVFKSLHDL